MNKGKSKKKMNSYLKMVLIMLAGGVVGWCWCVVLAGDLLPGAAAGGRPAGWWGGVNSGKKKSPCRR